MVMMIVIGMDGGDGGCSHGGGGAMLCLCSLFNDVFIHYTPYSLS